MGTLLGGVGGVHLTRYFSPPSSVRVGCTERVIGAGERERSEDEKG